MKRNERNQVGCQSMVGMSVKLFVNGVNITKRMYKWRELETSIILNSREVPERKSKLE